MFRVLLFLVMAGALSACSTDVTLHGPDNSLIGLCAAGVLGTSKINCVSPGSRIASTAQGSTALVMFLEPGDYASNLANSDESLRLLANSIPSQFSNIKQYLRQIFINIAIGHLKYLVSTYGSKYNNIYLYRTDVPWTPDQITLGLKNILTYNKTVDLFLGVHGLPGSIAINPDLTQKMSQHLRPLTWRRHYVATKAL